MRRRHKYKPIPLNMNKSPVSLESMYMCTGAQDTKNTLKFKLRNAIVNAAHHVNRVCVREHVKGNRIDRVGHFVTSLRREMQPHFSGSIVNLITQKAIWFDVGILDDVEYSYIRYRGSQRVALFTFQDLQEIVLMAQTQISHPSNQDIIKQEMEELKSQLTVNRMNVENMERLTKSFDEVTDKLVNLCSRISSLGDS